MDRGTAGGGRAPVLHSRKGLVSLVRSQLGPRVSVRKPISIGAIAERAAETHGRIPIYLDQPFDIDPERREELDYVEFALLVEKMSAAFAEAGVRPWDRVAIVKQPNFDMLAITWAAARLGAIPAVISPGLDGEIVGVLLDRLRAPFVFTDQATVDAMRLPLERWRGGVSARLIGDVQGGVPVADLWNAPVPPPTPRSGDEPMLITHTSSTTGISKLVENSVAGVSYTAFVEGGTPFGHSTRELAASCISFVHVRASITTMAALSRGTALLGIAKPTNEAVARLFCKYRPTAAEAHPNEFVRWEELDSHPGQPLSNIRVYFNSFDAAHPRTITRLLEASKRPMPLWFQAYGQTETQLISFRIYTRGSAKRLSARGTRSRSLGWPPPGVRIRIADPDTQKRVRTGTAGMIQVKTPARCLAFIGTPDKYWSRRHGPWFDTGDWGRKTLLGDVEIFDRVADRIEGVESCLWIEDVLLERTPGAEEIVLVPDSAQRPVPVVCMRDGEELDRSAWRAATASMPQLGEPFVVTGEALKRTATAKARRYLLTAMIDARRGDGAVPAENGAGQSEQELSPEVLLREGA